MERYPTPDMDSFAGFLDRRFEAFLLDGLLVVIATAILGYLVGALAIGGQYGGFGGAYLAAGFGSPFALLAYNIGLEGYYGQTLGKRLRGIVVVNEDGSNVGWFGAIVRNLLRFIDALPSFYIVGVISAYLSDETQRIGDRLGSTVVVYTQD